MRGNSDILVPDVDDAALARLAEKARAIDLSLEDYLRDFLEGVAKRTTPPRRTITTIVPKDRQ